MGKYAVHRSDGNTAPIVDAWRKAGATVELIGRPVDVLIGYHGRNFLAEIKTPRGKLRASQTAFLERWRGQVTIIRSVDEALDLLRRAGAA